MEETRDHAVVIGGSLAGLLAARVLADYFDHVTLVERDRFPGTPAHRPGVPQGHHLHFLWPRGSESIEKLFPGFEADMRAAGAPEIQIPKDIRWLSAAGWFPRFHATRILIFDRKLLDWTLRLLLPPSIEVSTERHVTGLIPRGNGVGGITFHERDGSGRAPGLDRELEADFVVDATGRASGTPEWLARLGYPAPRETRIDPLFGYASRHYAIPPDLDADWKAIYIQTSPPADKRTGVLFPVGSDRWMCSLGGAGRDYPPTEDEAFLDFAKDLRSPVLYEAIRGAEPLTPVRGFRHTANRRRHYDRMPAWPERFVVLGDAAFTFNPIYAQGMSIAAFQAVALDEWLGTHASARVFQRRTARTAAAAWLIATSEDQRFAETVGPPVRLWTRAINWYLSRVIAAATVDEQICARLLDVFTLRRRPSALFLPPVLARMTATTGAKAVAPSRTETEVAG